MDPIILHHTDAKICPMCESKLLNAHPELSSWFHKVKDNWINVHVSWTWRNELQQNRMFDQGLSMLKWPMSAHNHTLGDKPSSLALDLFQIDEDGLARFSPKFYKILWDWCLSNGLRLKWGGSFKTLGDAGHFQMTWGLPIWP